MAPNVHRMFNILFVYFTLFIDGLVSFNDEDTKIPQMFQEMNKNSSIVSFSRRKQRGRQLFTIVSKSNQIEEDKIASLERAASVAMCQASHGFDCWRFSTAPKTINQIKIYGERQTGTRFFKKLIDLNLDIEIATLDENTKGLHPLEIDLLYKSTYNTKFGWKHSCAPSHKQLESIEFEDLHRTLFLILNKNPYSWLLSIYSKLSRYKVFNVYSSMYTFIFLFFFFLFFNILTRMLYLSSDI